MGNPAGRFERFETVPFDDGWGTIDEEREPLRTEVIAEATRRILTRNDSPDVPYDLSINPYKGCEHGCVYCFARQTHAYLGLSPGLDFETKIFSKPQAAELLRKELSRRGYVPSPVNMGSNTDPYQPIERRLGITRSVLEVMLEFRHPVSIVTKSNLVLRDLDLLRALAADRLTVVYLSITTFDLALARALEPRAPTPERRLEAIRELSAAGVPTGVLASPMIPGLNDTELETILSRAAEAGAERAGTILLRLPHEVAPIFVEWLETHVPTKANKVIKRIREARGGKLYESAFGERMRGKGAFADLLQQRFAAAYKRLSLNDDRREGLRTDLFRVPSAQPRLF